MRNVITKYYQTRHATGFRSLSDTGRKDKGREELFPFGPLKRKGGRGESTHTGRKGKGREELFPFGPPERKRGRVKLAHTGQGKVRSRCWKCGQHGHLKKECKNVAAATNDNEEAYDDKTKYYDEDWMDWTGALTDD